MERGFQIAAVILALVAAYLLWTGQYGDGLFLTAVAGCVAFFLSIRFGAKKRLADHETEKHDP